MSLRLRMVVVVVLALAALAAAGRALARIARDSHAANLETAGADTAAAAAALAVDARRAPLPAPPLSGEAREALRARAAAVLLPISDTRGGFCFRDGDFVEAESGSFRRGHPPVDRGPPRGPPGSHGPPGPPPDERSPPPGEAPPRDPPPGEEHGPPGEVRGPPGPPPEVRAALARACEQASAQGTERVDVELRNETMVIVVAGVDERAAAFALRVVPGPGARSGLFGGVAGAVMPLVTLAMVAVMIETIFALRRGVRDLGGTLAKLEGDLRGEVARPRARELAEIADQLRAMARRLADARDRERALERQVAHQARLGSLGRVVAGVAHEIRNPLTGIKLLLDGMRRRDLDARTERDVRTCLREIGRLNDIVTTFLGIARGAQAEPAAFDLGALADERAAAAAAIAGPRGVRLVRRGTTAAFTERDAAVQIVDNLLRNAIEASPDGAEVEIAVSAEGAMARVDVVDRGEGVPEAIAEHLFEPFTTSKPGGTGLGLWLSRAMATSRGGDLTYAREAGRTRFTLTLPAAPP